MSPESFASDGFFLSECQFIFRHSKRAVAKNFIGGDSIWKGCRADKRVRAGWEFFLNFCFEMVHFGAYSTTFLLHFDYTHDQFFRFFHSFNFEGLKFKPVKPPSNYGPDS